MIYKLTNISQVAISSPKLLTCHPVRIEPSEYLYIEEFSLATLPLKGDIRSTVVKLTKQQIKDDNIKLQNGVAGTAMDKYYHYLSSLKGADKSKNNRGGKNESVEKLKVKEVDFTETVIEKPRSDKSDAVVEPPKFTNIIKPKPNSKLPNLALMTKKELKLYARAEGLDIDFRLGAARLREAITNLRGDTVLIR